MSMSRLHALVPVCLLHLCAGHADMRTCPVRCGFASLPRLRPLAGKQKLDDMTAEDLERMKESDMLTEMIAELTKDMPRLVRSSFFAPDAVPICAAVLLRSS